MRRAAGTLAVLALASVACASPRSVVASRASPEESFSPLPHTFNWDQPFNGTGVDIKTFEEVQQLMPFTLHVPSGLGAPRFVISSTGTPPELMGVYFVYKASPYGLLWVVEALPDIPGDQERLTAYENRVAANGTEGLRSIAEVVLIRDGIPALVGTGSQGIATVEFVESGVQYSILGPTLGRDDAVTIAESI